jgi:hypothetical protein
MVNIVGSVGECIRASEVELVLEVGEGEWDYVTYVKEVARMQQQYALLPFMEFLLPFMEFLLWLSVTEE